MERVDYESLIIQDLLSFHKDKSLDVNPWYQRRSVWSDPQKAYLINTINERKPVPSIYIRHHIDLDADRSVKEVVDGQQRVRSIISYRADEFSARHPDHKKKVKYSELTKPQQQKFLSTKLSAGYLIGADDRDVIEIFGRINSIAKTLNPQEKRNANFSGEFKQFCLKEAVDRLAFWRNASIFTANDISRMQEVQFTSDLVINLMQGLSDYSASLVDKYYRDFDSEFARDDEISGRLKAVFDKLAAIPPAIIAESIFSTDQVLLSLIVALDAKGPATVSAAKITEVIQDTDAKISAYRDLDIQSEIETKFLAGFTGGNLHRSRSRNIRNEILTAALA